MRKKFFLFVVAFIISFFSLTIYDFVNIPTDLPIVNELVPGGNAIGVKINMDGVIVVGETPVESINGKKITPAKDAGIKSGDVINSLNNKKINSIDDLVKIVEDSGGNPISVNFTRKDKEYNVNVIPTFSKEDNVYKLGVWVKENTSGIGTITYFNPKTNSFGALGHPITESETSQIVDVKDGEVLSAEIGGIKKSEKGLPGELKGTFSSNESIGLITQNNEFGVFGTLNLPINNNKPIPVATIDEIKEDSATILTNIEGNKVEEYNIDILRVMPTAKNTNKALIIRVTDERLLAKTGGIVQGMSGSPIIQNGKLVGAITHVFVNDPTKGFGILVNSMLQMEH